MNEPNTYPVPPPAEKPTPRWAMTRKQRMTEAMEGVWMASRRKALEQAAQLARDQGANEVADAIMRLGHAKGH